MSAPWRRRSTPSTSMPDGALDFHAMLKRLPASIRARMQQLRPIPIVRGNPFSRGVEDGVEFALYSARLILGWLPGGSKYLSGRWFLEIGPGQDFGMPLVLMGYGAKVVLIDRFLCQWTAQIHRPFYRRLKQRAAEEFPGLDLDPIERVIAADSHAIEGMVAVRTGLESVDFLRSDLIDISYSNATFEHLADIPQAIVELGRITRPGGIGFHQIDLRDHRSVDKPLEYLTLSEAEYQELVAARDHAFGTVMRASEFQTCFARAGFDTHFDADALRVDEAYFASVKQRLDARFREIPDDILRVLGGRYFLTHGDVAPAAQSRGAARS